MTWLDISLTRAISKLTILHQESLPAVLHTAVPVLTGPAASHPTG
jgi:hypothetical protein